MKGAKSAGDPIAQNVLRAYSIVSKLAISKKYREIAFETILRQLLQKGLTGETSTSLSEKGRPNAKAAREALPNRIKELVSEGYFKEPKGTNEVLDELKNRGYHHTFASVGMALLSLVRKRVVRRVPTKVSGKKLFLYTNP